MTRGIILDNRRLLKISFLRIVALALVNSVTLPAAQAVSNFDNDAVSTQDHVHRHLQRVVGDFQHSRRYRQCCGFMIMQSFLSSLTREYFVRTGLLWAKWAPPWPSFSALPLSSISMSFATNSPSGGVPFQLNAFNGSTLVGTISATGTIPPGGFTYPEGVISFSGATFDNVVLSVAPSDAPDFAIDNITATFMSGPSTTCPAPTSALYGSAYSSQLIGSNGSGTGYSWNLLSGSFAPLTLSPSGLVSGTLTPTGGSQTMNFTIGITDSLGATGQQPCSIIVLPPVITFACPANTASVGALYSAQLTSMGGGGGGLWSVTSGTIAPLTLTLGGGLSGIPTAPGTLNFTLRVIDNVSGGSTTQPCSLTVMPVLVTLSTTCPTATARVGVGYSSQLVGAGGSGSGFSWTLANGSLAPLNLSMGGLVSGTPMAAGVLNFTVKITDSAGGTAQQPCTLTVTVPLSTTCPIASATFGIAYSSQLLGAGGSGTGYSWSLAGGLLTPLTLSGGGLVSGTATTPGVLNFTLKLTDSAGSTVQQPCAIVVTTLGSTCPTVEATISVAYTSQLVGFGGSGTGYSWTLVAGSLGPLSLSPTGLISGTPTATGNLTFTFKITDSAGTSTIQSQCGIIIALPVGTTCPAVTATVGVSYSQQLTGSGGLASPTGYTWSLASGSLAPLTLSPTGLVSGTPTASGTLNFTLKITDSSAGGGGTAQQACTITVAAITITQSNSTTGSNQTTLSVALPQAAANAFTGTLTLTFTPDPGLNNVPVGYADPAGGFPIGAQSPTSFTFNFTIPQGATQPLTPPAFGRGTVAGTWTATLTALSTGGSSALVGSPPAQTVVIPLAAPVIDSNAVKIINVTSTGFGVELSGSVTSRAVSSASFMFTPAAGGQLSGSSVTLPFNGQDQTQWFNTTAGQAAGGTFSLLVAFPYTGDPAAIGTVTVTLTGPQGTSVPVTGGE